MGKHVTKQLLEALAVMVLGEQTAAGGNVFVNRVSSLPRSKLPAVVIVGGDEALEVGMQGMVDRQIEAALVVAVAEADGYDDQAYEILLQLEHMIAADRTARGRAHSVVPYAVEWGRSDEGDQPILRAALRLRAELVVEGNAVDVLT